MPLAIVVEHSVGQLELIYQACARVRAEEKLMDLDNLTVVVSAAVGGKTGPLNKLIENLTAQANQAPPKPASKPSNRAAHLARLKALGAQT